MTGIVRRVAVCTAVGIGVPATAAAQTSEVEELRRLLDRQQQQLEAQQEQLRAMRERLERLTRDAPDSVRVPESPESVTRAAPAASPAGTPAGTGLADAGEEDTGPRHVRLGDGNVIRQGDFEGSFLLPDTGLSLRIGGYVKADAIVDFGDAGSDDVFVTSSIPVTGGGRDISTRLHARQSRLNLDARANSDRVPLRVFIEGDFFGGGGNQTVSNSHSFRLRHAFGSYGGLLAGQTWTNFMDVAGLPETLDFEGPPGQSSIRQTQLRWTQRVNDRVSVIASLENPETDVISNGVSIADDRLPDATLRALWTPDRGHLQASTVLRDLAVNDGSGLEDEAFGWGVGVSGVVRLPVLGKDDNVTFQANFGQGIGRYILDIAGLGSDAAVNAAGTEIETLTAFGGYAGYQHWWMDDLRSTFVAGFADLEPAASQAGTTFDNSQYLSGNIVWSPIPRVNLGAELLYGRRENKNGADGDAWRLQFSSQFVF